MQIQAWPLIPVVHSVEPDLPWLTGPSNAPPTSPAPTSAGPEIMIGGFAKSGTKAITAIFEQLGFSAAHEHNGGTFGKLYMAYRDGNKTKTDVSDWLKNEHAHFPVQVSTHFLYFDMLPIIFETFPDTRFIFIIRQVDDWANSMYDQAPTGAAMFAPVTRMQIGLPEDYHKLPPEEDTPEVHAKLELLHDHGFPAHSFVAMARYYCKHYITSVSTVPSHKLLLVETERLSDDATVKKLMRFADPAVTPAELLARVANVTERDRHTKNERLGVYDRLSDAYIASVVEAEVCAPLRRAFAVVSRAGTGVPSWCQRESAGTKALRRRLLRARSDERPAARRVALSVEGVWGHLNATRHKRTLTGGTRCCAI